MSQRDASDGAIVVFDGVCVLCSGWVRFLLRFDRRGHYRFASMQGDAGRALLARAGLDPDDPLSLLLVDGGHSWSDSDAIIRIVAGLGGPWRLAGLLRALPRPIRDPLYRAVARHRYRLFGRREACLLPDPAQRGRFLE